MQLAVGLWCPGMFVTGCLPARLTHAPCDMTTTEMSVKNWPVPLVAAIIKASLPIESCVVGMHQPPQ